MSYRQLSYHQKPLTQIISSVHSHAKTLKNRLQFLFCVFIHLLAPGFANGFKSSFNHEYIKPLLHRTMVIPKMFCYLQCLPVFNSCAKVITLMNGNKGSKAVLCSPRCSPKHFHLLAPFWPIHGPLQDRFLRYYIVANCSTNFEIISLDNEVQLHNGLSCGG